MADGFDFLPDGSHAVHDGAAMTLDPPRKWESMPFPRSFYSRGEHSFYSQPEWPPKLHSCAGGGPCECKGSCGGKTCGGKTCGGKSGSSLSRGAGGSSFGWLPDGGMSSPSGGGDGGVEGPQSGGCGGQRDGTPCLCRPPDGGGGVAPPNPITGGGVRCWKCDNPRTRSCSFETRRRGSRCSGTHPHNSEETCKSACVSGVLPGPITGGLYKCQWSSSDSKWSCQPCPDATDETCTSKASCEAACPPPPPPPSAPNARGAGSSGRCFRSSCVCEDLKNCPWLRGWGGFLDMDYFSRLSCCLCGHGVGGYVQAVLKKFGIEGDTDTTEGGNAFQHCIAACRSVKVCGWRCAHRFWDGREDGKTNDSLMDMANNQVGYHCWKKNCAECCFEKWEAGKLTCIEWLPGPKGETRLKPCPKRSR